MAFTDVFGRPSPPPASSTHPSSSASSPRASSPFHHNEADEVDNPVPPTTTDPWSALQSQGDPQLTAPNPRKRPADELEHWVKKTAKREQMGVEDTQFLSTFAKQPVEAQHVELMAKLIKIQKKQDELHPPEVGYKIPDSLLKSIEDLVVQKILFPSAPSYMDKETGIVKTVMDAITMPTAATPALVKKQRATIEKRVRERNNDRRSEYKAAIANSMWEPVPAGKAVHAKDRTLLDKPQTIYDLCKTAVDIHASAGVDIDIKLLARMAFLRHCLSIDAGTRFWDNVDDELKAIRTEYADRLPADRARETSNAFYRCLKADCQKYGPFNLSQWEHDSENAS
ncbi:hypothetical protein PENSPDRAFT_759398 [Peniophora sp. CONT]|nr:hypothetical protein PENSPDRAFT_759398 [Peniophora sp. CONT]